MTDRRTVTTVVIVIAICLGGLAIVGDVGGQSSTGNLTAEDPIVGAEATHTAEIAIDSNDGVAGSSLAEAQIDYSPGVAPDLTNVTETNDIVRAGIDSDGDGTIEESAMDDLEGVSLTNSDQTLNIDFGGNVDTSAGDTIIVEYTNLTNPDDPGPHDVTIAINPGSGDTTATPAYELLEPLTIETYTFAPVDREADLVLNASDQLDTIAVDISGDRTVTLDETDFTHHGNGNYTADNVSQAEPGDYTATLTTASNTTDGYTRDAATDQTTSTSIGALSIDGGSASPETVDPATTESGQTFTATVHNLSNGDGHTITVEFPSALDGQVDPDRITVTDGSTTTENTSPTASGRTVTADVGFDDGTDLNDVEVTLTADVTYPAATENTDLQINTTVDDTDGSTADSSIATVSVRDLDAVSIDPGSTTNGTVEPAETVTHEVTIPIDDLTQTGDIANMTVEIPGAITPHAELKDVTATNSSVDVVATPSLTGESIDIDLDPGSDGGTTSTDVVVTLANATYGSETRGETYAFNATIDDNGDGTTDTENGVATVDVTDPPTVAVADGSVDPHEVQAGGTVTGQEVSVTVTDLLRDGDVANVSIAYPDALRNEVSVMDVTTDTGTVTGHTPKNGERVDVDLNVGNGGGTTDATLTLTADVTYPTATDGTRLWFGTTATDSDGNSDTDDRVANVSVGDLAPATIVDGSIDPNAVDPGETGIQTVTVDIGNLTQDGEDATLTVTLPDQLDGNYTVENTSGDGIGVVGNSTAGTTITVTLDAGSGGGTTDGVVTIDLNSSYHTDLEDGEYEVNATIDDTDGTSDASRPLARVAVGAVDTGISSFSASSDDADDDGVDDALTVSFESDTQLDSTTVAIDGPVTRTISLTEFNETRTGDWYAYTATATVGDDDDVGGEYEATLTDATDEYGNDVADAESDTATISRNTDGGGAGDGGSGSGDTPLRCSATATADLDDTDPVDHETTVCAVPGADLEADYTTTDRESAIGVQVRRYEIVPDTYTDFDLSITVTNSSAASTPGGIDSTPPSVAHPVMVDIDRRSGDPDSIREGSLVVALDPSRFGGAPPEAITVYAVANGTWSPINATHTGTVSGDLSASTNSASGSESTSGSGSTSGSASASDPEPESGGDGSTATAAWYEFTIPADNSERYVVATDPGSIVVVDAAHPDDHVPVGTDTTTRMTVRNDGYAVANRTLTVTAARRTDTGTVAGDGSERRSVATRSVTLDPGETRTITTTWSPEQPGNYAIAVDSVAAGRLRVAAPSTPVSEPKPDGTTTAMTTVLIAFIVGLLVTIIALSRRATGRGRDRDDPLG